MTPAKTGHGQTRLIAQAPKLGDPLGGNATATVVVDSTKFAEASPVALQGLEDLLLASIRARGGDPAAVTYTAEPIGPQIRLVAVNGARL